MLQLDANGLNTIRSTTIPGTDGHSKGIAVSTDKQRTDAPFFDVAWEQYGTTGSNSIQYIGLTEAGQNPATPQTISSAYSVWNKNISIVSLTNDSPYVAWRQDNSGTWDPWQVKVALHDPWGGVHHTYDHHVRSVALNKLNDNSEFYLGWSQIYDDPAWTDYNTYMAGSSLGSMQYADTKGEGVQLVNGASASQAYLASFYRSASPKYIQASASFGGAAKQLAGRRKPQTAHYRGAIVESDGVGFMAALGNIRAGSQPVSLVPAPDTAAHITRAGLRRSLQTQPFTLSAAQPPVFTLQTGHGDSAATARLLQGNRVVRFKLQLVDAASGRVLGTAHTLTYRTGALPARGARTYSLEAGRYDGRSVRLRLSVETNLDAPELSRLEEYAALTPKQPAPATASRSMLSLQKPTAPDRFALQANYPNPFNPTTTIAYQLPEQAEVSLKVYNLTGRLVQTLVQKSQQPGRYAVDFDASGLASGVYLYRLRAGDYHRVRRMLLVK